MAYIQDKEILTIAETSRSTPLGTKVLSIHFTDGSVQELTEKTFNRIKSDEAIDATELRRRKVQPVAEEILIVMREADLKVSEVEFLFNLVGLSVDQNFNRATNKLWEVSEAGERTFLMADEILKNGDDTNSNNQVQE